MSDIWLFIRAQATATFAFLRTYISGLFGSGGTNDPTVRFAAHAGPGGAGGGGTTIDPLTAWYNRNIRRHFRGPGTQPSTIQKGIKGINQFGQNLQNLPSQFMPGGSSADALSAAQTAYTSTLAAFPGYSGLFGEGGGDQGGGAAPQGVMQFAGMPRAQQIAIAQRNARGRTGRVRADVRQQNYQAYLQSMAAAQNAALMNKAQGGFLTSENFTLLEGRYPLAFESDEFRRALRRHFPRGPGLAAIDSFGLHNRRGAAVMAVQ